MDEGYAKGETCDENGISETDEVRIIVRPVATNFDAKQFFEDKTLQLYFKDTTGRVMKKWDANYLSVQVIEQQFNNFLYSFWGSSIN
mmetsp:Transcript_5203/g.6945  ORF Transcript_5203/g.6945 Transcript_5203/m.6945 type:complete len:87 (-) Transcript_5203:1085-1345(-)|eukprot:CAMPEP_0185586230 /NCGR_PEP_ID=MMETSP0434-20130131/43207_1 /TAXON_ID=626734 ORGANISM="Favella taraikaensis, Strain Fe Narragansett Bay" /NCGR_SAMPLE_ID=MMETSP0434 /ASSEMBLY_ACC=CAM_ASM_000379 /LENGTH=86 /DNA_ID=CAMNT_0028207191 /DNA_START=481 /DNA_END=741 /DNA_ORIENTATION=-